MIVTIFNLAIAAIAAWAAIADVHTRRIPNWCIATIAVLALGAAGFSGGLALAAASFGVALAALAAGVLIHALGMIGAGDAKLLAALALWMGAARMPAFLIALALATLVLAAWSIATRGGRVKVGEGGLAALPKRATLPLGLALSVSAMAAVFVA